ncbi:hypothetical protein Tco_0057536 [Tanacetum coccineum]
MDLALQIPWVSFEAIRAVESCLGSCGIANEILKKFDFATVKTASTPMEPNKVLVKDEEADSVDVHLYRSMIGSLMYLTASRPDITFAVCACVRFQVTPKTLHLHVVKRIFRYLKGQPKLGLWYPRDSPFDLEAFSDSDYAGASLDRKSTTGGAIWIEVGRIGLLYAAWQKLVLSGIELVLPGKLSTAGKPLEEVLLGFWNTACLKTINSEKQIHANVDGKPVVVSESSVRIDLHLNDEDGTACLTTNEIFENLALMGYEPASD